MDVISIYIYIYVNVPFQVLHFVGGWDPCENQTVPLQGTQLARTRPAWFASQWSAERQQSSLLPQRVRPLPPPFRK